MSEQNENKEMTIEFVTQLLFFAQSLGGGTEGAVTLDFITPDGQPNYKTLIGPHLTSQVLATMASAAKSIPSIDAFMSLDLPGRSLTQEGSVKYFDQDYDPAVLQALGLLTVRVNLLEKSLIKLLASFLQIPINRTAAVYYSTVNMKSRIDSIRAACAASAVRDSRKKQVYSVLDKVEAVTKRRNFLIHAQWHFDGPNLKAETPSPINPKPMKLDVTAELVLTLAADYRNIGMLVEAWAMDSGNAQDMKNNVEGKS